GQSRPCPPPNTGKTKWMIHPAGSHSSLAVRRRDSQRTFESCGAVAAFVAFHLKMEQLKSDRQQNCFPAERHHRWIRQRWNCDLPAGGSPSLECFALLLNAQAHTI